MSRIPYTFARDSIAAVINPLAESRLVQAGIPIVGYPGVRGGGGFLIMPAVTQLFYDNYFSNQTVDQAVGAPWTEFNTATVRDENTLLGGLSVELPGDGGVNYVYRSISPTNALLYTSSAFIYAPPPATLHDIRIPALGVGQIPTFISLGGYWYFVFYTFTGDGSSDWYGVLYNDSDEGGSIWVDCLSLTQTDAPVGFVPNAQTDATQASADDNLKFTLAEPLPQSGAISFVYIPFYDNDGSGSDDTPYAVSFLPKDLADNGDDFITMQMRDVVSEGLNVAKKKDGGSAEETFQDGHGGSGFSAFEPIEFVIDWDFAPGGTKLVRIWANGELQVESDNYTEGWPTNLVDMWVGVRRAGASSWTNHAQAIIQDIQIHRR